MLSWGVNRSDGSCWKSSASSAKSPQQKVWFASVCCLCDANWCTCEPHKTKSKRRSAHFVLVRRSLRSWFERNWTLQRCMAHQLHNDFQWLPSTTITSHSEPCFRRWHQLIRRSSGIQFFFSKQGDFATPWAFLGLGGNISTLCHSPSLSVSPSLRESVTPNGWEMLRGLEMLWNRFVAFCGPKTQEHQQLLIESLGDDELKLLQLSQKCAMPHSQLAMLCNCQLSKSPWNKLCTVCMTYEIN